VIETFFPAPKGLEVGGKIEQLMLNLAEAWKRVPGPGGGKKPPEAAGG